MRPLLRNNQDLVLFLREFGNRLGQIGLDREAEQVIFLIGYSIGSSSEFLGETRILLHRLLSERSAHA